MITINFLAELSILNYLTVRDDWNISTFYKILFFFQEVLCDAVRSRQMIKKSIVLSL